MITIPKSSSNPETSLLPPAPIVVLAGGGIDSSIMLARTLQQRRCVIPLYVRQGAVWEDAEEAALRQFLAALPAAGPPDGARLEPLHVLRLDWPDAFAGRWAVDGAVQPPDEASPDAAVYLPGRNLGLLTMAAQLAQSQGARTILIGLLSGNPFADSRPAFFQSFERTVALATEYNLHVEAPLSAMSKQEVILAGRDLPLQFTFSCLRPQAGRHCGRCNKCAERRRGFRLAGMEDPTEYIVDS